MFTRLTAAAVLTLSLAATASAVAPPTPTVAAIRALIRELDAEGFAERQRAETSLRAMGAGVLPTLRAELAREKALEAKERLGRVVRELSFPERVPELVALLGDADAGVRDRAEKALRQAGAKAVPLLEREIRPDNPIEVQERLKRIVGR